ncbi:RIP metalloprotease RseP [Lactococcus paracarnosus]|uniref:Zinc metalloprotease n=1 Tax=Pseudolactococcus paracarnosus TaxID=2749962 RepID=A0A7L4W9Q6_9LACT|nr:RIP metalloprotease RseP [Lactococcus paracarnosus]QDJ27066.1 RIP metalloprotease RseP [Lactococcus paracarnosus]SPC37690.1 putative enzyme [Lactococcus piscium]
MIQSIITFIIIFGIIVCVHEYGHLYFAKKSGILVREFSIGMGPKIYAHQAKDGTVYTIRILPLGGYVRMAGWGEDTTEIKTGAPVSLTLDSDSLLVTRINLSDKVQFEQSLPMLVTAYDFEHALTITGEVNGQVKTYSVDHDATVVEEDGTELRIAPIDVQYQSASLPGRMMTNFAGPLNNFILGIVACILVAFMQGSVQDLSSNKITVTDKNLPAYQAGLRTGDTVKAINGTEVSDWQSLSDQIIKSDGKAIKVKTLKDSLVITPKKQDKAYIIGISPNLKTGFFDKVSGGVQKAATYAFTIINALKNLILHPSLNKLGGPVAMYQMTGQAAREGLTTVIGFMALLSINLGIFNLMPIPALDGGKIVMNIIEAIRRKPMKQEHETIITLVGVGFMVLLMIAVTWNDILRLFR